MCDANGAIEPADWSRPGQGAEHHDPAGRAWSAECSIAFSSRCSSARASRCRAAQRHGLRRLGPGQHRTPPRAASSRDGGVDSTAELTRVLLPAGYLDPIVTRVIIVVTIKGIPHVLSDGVITTTRWRPPTPRVRLDAQHHRRGPLACSWTSSKMPFMRYPAMRRDRPRSSDPGQIRRPRHRARGDPADRQRARAIRRRLRHPHGDRPGLHPPARRALRLRLLRRAGAGARHQHRLLGSRRPKVPIPQPALSVDLDEATNVDSLSLLPGRQGEEDPLVYIDNSRPRSPTRSRSADPGAQSASCVRRCRPAHRLSPARDAFAEGRSPQPADGSPSGPRRPMRLRAIGPPDLDARPRRSVARAPARRRPRRWHCIRRPLLRQERHAQPQARRVQAALLAHPQRPRSRPSHVETMSADAASRSARRYFGKYRGMVIANIDPSRSGRLLVSVPDVLGAVAVELGDALRRRPTGKQMGSCSCRRSARGSGSSSSRATPTTRSGRAAVGTAAEVPRSRWRQPPIPPGRTSCCRRRRRTLDLISDLPPAPGPAGSCSRARPGPCSMVNDTGITSRTARAHRS